MENSAHQMHMMHMYMSVSCTTTTVDLRYGSEVSVKDRIAT